MVVFDIDHSPSLRRHDPHYSQETIDVTRTTTATTRNTAGNTSSTDPTAVTTTTTAQNGAPSSSSSSSPSSSSSSRLSPSIATHNPVKSGNSSTVVSSSAGPASASITTATATTSSYSSLSSMETDDDNNNNNNMVLVEDQRQQQQQQQQQLQRQVQQQQQFPKQRRRVSFASTNTVTIIDDNPFLFTDYEKSICFCSRKDRALFEQDRISVYSSYDRHMKYGLTWKETDEITLRGLEDFFGMRSKEEIRHEHVIKVLKEQTRQRQLRLLQGVELDADTLRYVSSESSAEGRQRAAVVGRDDAIVAQRCFTLGNATTTTTSTTTTRINNGKNTMTHHHHASSSCHVTCLASWEQQWFY